MIFFDADMNVHWLRASILLFWAQFVIHHADGYHFLTVILGPRSHRLLCDPMIEALVSRNHNVTVVSFYPNRENPSPKVKEVIVDASVGDVFKTYMGDIFKSKLEGNSEELALQDSYLSITNDINSRVVRSESFRRFVQSADLHFDAVLIDVVFSEIGFALAYRFGDAPTIYFSPCKLTPNIFWRHDVPSPLSYVPYLHSKYSVYMDIWQRLASTLLTLRWIFYFEWQIVPLVDSVYRTHFPGIPPYSELEKNASVILLNSYPTTDYVRPLMPKVVEIGGYSLRDIKPLEGEFSEIAESSGKDGFVVFSLGLLADEWILPNDTRNKIISVLKRIGLPIVMKWSSSSRVPGYLLPSNVKIFDWIPQQDLLGHPNCRLFITHAGTLSVMESLNGGGVPILALPWGVEQRGNAANLLTKSPPFAESADVHPFSEGDFYSKATHLLETPSFAQNAKRHSLLFKDRPMRPVDSAVFWMEYVARHKGASHFSSAAHTLNFFQYFLLDVVFAFLVLPLVGLAVVLKLLLRLCSDRKCPMAARYKKLNDDGEVTKGRQQWQNSKKGENQTKGNKQPQTRQMADKKVKNKKKQN